jgi:hypothetical protein
MKSMIYSLLTNNKITEYAIACVGTKVDIIKAKQIIEIPKVKNTKKRILNKFN